MNCWSFSESHKFVHEGSIPSAGTKETVRLVEEPVLKAGGRAKGRLRGSIPLVSA